VHGSRRVVCVWRALGFFPLESARAPAEGAALRQARFFVSPFLYGAVRAGGLLDTARLSSTASAPRPGRSLGSAAAEAPLCAPAPARAARHGGVWPQEEGAVTVAVNTVLAHTIKTCGQNDEARPRRQNPTEPRGAAAACDRGRVRAAVKHAPEPRGLKRRRPPQPSRQFCARDNLCPFADALTAGARGAAGGGRGQLQGGARRDRQDRGVTRAFCNSTSPISIDMENPYSYKKCQ
jgi:hypothetical protein